MISKVIAGLTCCQISMSDNDPFEKCTNCPYNNVSINVEDCRSILSKDTLKVIKAMSKIINKKRFKHRTTELKQGE